MVVLADQAGKVWATARFGSSAGQADRLGPVQTELVRNSGAAFGLGRTLTVWITLVTLAAVAALAAAGWRARRPAPAVAYGLLLGGALGNGIDRLARSPAPLHGAVVDWIKLPFYGPVFNLADIAVRAGALLAVILLLHRPRAHTGSDPGMVSAAR